MTFETGTALAMESAGVSAMFDLISGDAHRTLAHQDPRVLLIAGITQTAIGALLVAVPLFYVTNSLPPAPVMMAFVATAPPAPPPPPPAAPAPAARTTAPRTESTAGRFAAPIEAPREIRPETGTAGVAGGVPGGVEGGIPGGVIGGVVGGLPAPLPPPPPPPAPPRAPVRVGGSIQAPILLHRIEPVYPPSALAAKIGGVVILEAVVDESGRVTSVKTLRSHPLLERASIEAVRQWRYSPLILSGEPQSFVLTVTLTFTAR
jgi:protein TonB